MPSKVEEIKMNPIEENKNTWNFIAGTNGLHSTPIESIPTDSSKIIQQLDPFNLVDFSSFDRAMLIGAGGGNFSPLYSALGKKVTLIDISSEQLKKDRKVCRDNKLEVDCIESSALDIPQLDILPFPYAFMAVCDIYFPSVVELYQAIASKLLDGAYFYAHLWNPVWMQVKENQITFPSKEGFMQEIKEEDGLHSTYQHIHPIEFLFGGLCDVGFEIIKIKASKSDRYKNDRITPAYHVLARKASTSICR
jgi:hypothetical protein